MQQRSRRSASCSRNMRSCASANRAPLNDGEARAIASMIGPIKDPVGRTRDGGTLRYSEDRQIIDAGFVLTDELRAELGDINFGGLDSERPGLFETFHTDDTYTECPAAATVLHARELPSSPGGATHFLDMRAAYRVAGARAAGSPHRTTGCVQLQQPWCVRGPGAGRRPVRAARRRVASDRALPSGHPWTVAVHRPRPRHARRGDVRDGRAGAVAVAPRPRRGDTRRVTRTRGRRTTCSSGTTRRYNTRRAGTSRLASPAASGAS